jgi:hypothetical protein
LFLLIKLFFLKEKFGRKVWLPSTTLLIFLPTSTGTWFISTNFFRRRAGNVLRAGWMGGWGAAEWFSASTGWTLTMGCFSPRRRFLD